MSDDASHLVFDVAIEEWVYTVLLAVLAAALFAGAGALAAAIRWRRLPWLLAAALLLSVGVVGVPLALRATREESGFIALQNHLYASDLLLAGAHAAAALVGLAAVALVAGSAALLMRRRAGRAGSTAPAIALLLVVPALAVALVAVVDAMTDEADRGNHPPGTDASAVVQATRILAGAPFAVGLAPAPGGDLYFVELSAGVLRVLPSADGPTPGPVETVAELPVPPGGLAFSVLLHPAWPAEPYLYVSAQHDVGGAPRLRLLRLRVEDRRAVEIVPLVEGLPTEPEPGGDHFGAALASCGGYLFLSIGDTESPASPSYGDDRRHRAQRPDAGEGKILRYRLDGADLIPAGLIASDPPVYAMGFRNPFAMLCDEATSLLIVADNGPEGRDQLRVVPPASNHEWPLSVDRDRLATPLWSSGLLPLGPTGVALRGAPDRERAGASRELLLTAFHSGGLYAFDFDGGRVPAAPRLLLQLPSGALEVAAGPGGCVYVSDVTSIWRLDEGRC